LTTRVYVETHAIMDGGEDEGDDEDEGEDEGDDERRGDAQELYPPPEEYDDEGEEGEEEAEVRLRRTHRTCAVLC